MRVPEIEALRGRGPAARGALAAARCSRSTARTGRPTRWRRCAGPATLLADELGVDPGPALRTLEAEVLAQSPSLDAPELAPVPVPEVLLPEVPVARHRAADPACRARRGSRQSRDEPRRPGAGARPAAPAAWTRRSPASRRLALIEGPPGIGKTRLLQEVRRLAAAARRAGARPRAAASSSGSSASARCGSCSSRRSRDAGRPGAAARRRRGRRGRGSSTRARATGTAGGRPVRGAARAVLADRQPGRAAAAGARGRRRAVVRQRLAALPRLPGAPARRACRCWSSATLRTGEQHDDEELLAELVRRPRHRRRCSPRPLSPDGDRARWSATGCGERADEAFVGRLPPHHRRQPAAAAPAAAGAGGRAASGPDASHADTVRAIGSRAVSSLVLLPAAAGWPRECTARWPARSRCSATARRCRWSPR